MNFLTNLHFVLKQKTDDGKPNKNSKYQRTKQQRLKNKRKKKQNQVK